MLAFDRHDGGDDGTIVLLHSLALDRSVYDGLVPHLLDRFDVIALDLPNHGASPTLEETTIDAMADAVASTIEREVDGPAIVAGLSLGGCVAQAVAVRHPALVRGLALLDTTCWYGETAPSDWEGRAQKAANDGFDSLAGFQLDRWFSPGFGDANPALGERLLEVFRSNDIDAYVATCRAMGAMDMREQIDAITAPTCIIVGADDPATPPPHAEAMRQRIAGAGMHVVPGCGHLSAAERPETIAGLLAVDLFPRL
ncbi:MAG: alpha/beta fold hydrolase [Nitriliruptoraceae bacterium]|nr:alpha/beta fold hydrolase [Nitriliruptoraceae bacterium]